MTGGVTEELKQEVFKYLDQIQMEMQLTWIFGILKGCSKKFMV